MEVGRAQAVDAALHRPPFPEGDTPLFRGGATVRKCGHSQAEPRMGCEGDHDRLRWDS